LYDLCVPLHAYVRDDLFPCIFVCLSLYHSAHLSVFLSACLSVFLSVLLSVFSISSYTNPPYSDLLIRSSVKNVKRRSEQTAASS
jgi:hypothetical protein